MEKNPKSFYSKKLLESAKIAVGILAAIETVMGVTGMTLMGIKSWWGRLLLIAAGYILLTFIVFIVLTFRRKMTFTIRGIPVTIKIGDIFKSPDWKLISFTEYFDTRVDDVIVSRNSLNGKFVEICKSKDKFDIP